MSSEDIDYKELFQNMQIENEVLRHQLKRAPRFSFSLPDLDELTWWISEPTHLFGIFIGLWVIAITLQCVALWRETRK